MSDNTGLTTKEMAFFILLNYSSILAMGAWCFWVNKMALNNIHCIFDEIIYIFDNIIDSDWSDDYIEEIPQIPKPMLPHYDSSESFPEITEPPPPYQLNAD